jgi:Tol biopolymer transport system component
LRLQEQPFGVLRALLEHPGEVVSREELVHRLWPDHTFVDFERGLNAAVTRLRQALSDTAENPRYVETVTRRGYRFVGSILPEVEVQPATPAAPKRRLWIYGTAVLAIFGAVAAGIWSTRHSWPASTADRPLIVAPLTSEPGFAECATFSPDGDQVAYEWDQGRHEPRIFVRVVGPGDPVRLTTGSTAESCPAWSPDGKFVAFIRTLEGSKEGVFLIPARGGGERKLAEFDHWRTYYPQFRPRLLDWTPDAKHLIFVAPDDSGFSRLLVVATDTGAKTPLTLPGSDGRYWDRDPAISPDGKLLAFSREASYGSSDLYLLALSGDLRGIGNPRRLTSEEHSGRYAQTPVWTPDGHEIIFSSNRDGSPRLWRIGLQQGDMPRQVNSVGSDSGFPAISRRGRMVFARGFWDANIWRQELLPHSGKMNAPQRLIESTAQDSAPQYSPDGTLIAFQSARSGSYEIWICGSAGDRCRQLTSFNGPVTGTPRWSPDEKKIVFDSAAAGNFNVYVIDPNGGSPQRITFDTDNAIIPSWSHDGKWIYFAALTTGRTEIWKIPASGGAAVQLTRNGGFTAFEDPGGQYIYYTKKEEKSGLFRSRTDGSGETQIAEDVIMRGIAPTLRKIFYLRQENDNGLSTLRSLEWATGRNTSVATITTPLDSGLTVSPDGRYALYVQVDRQGSTLMLVDDFR